MKKIVFVDDDNSIREAFHYIIPSTFEVMTAKDGKEGLDLMLKENSFYALITDFNMPIMTGLDLILEVLNRKIPVSKIIVMSGNPSNRILIEELKKRFKQIYFIEKPFSPDELTNLI